MPIKIGERLDYERHGPVCLGLVACAIWLWMDVRFPKSEDLLSAAMTLAGIFVGFISTTKAIILGGNFSGVLIRLRESGYMIEFNDYLRAAINGGLAFCVVNILGFFVPKGNHIYGALWVGVGLFAMAAFYRISKVMLALIVSGGKK